MENGSAQASRRKLLWNLKISEDVNSEFQVTMTETDKKSVFIDSAAKSSSCYVRFGQQSGYRILNEILWYQ